MEYLPQNSRHADPITGGRITQNLFQDFLYLYSEIVRHVPYELCVIYALHYLHPGLG